MHEIIIKSISPVHYDQLSAMVGELLHEIMGRVNEKVFQF